MDKNLCLIILMNGGTSLFFDWNINHNWINKPCNNTHWNCLHTGCDTPAISHNFNFHERPKKWMKNGLAQLCHSSQHPINYFIINVWAVNPTVFAS